MFDFDGLLSLQVYMIYCFFISVIFGVSMILDTERFIGDLPQCVSDIIMSISISCSLVQDRLNS